VNTTATLVAGQMRDTPVGVLDVFASERGVRAILFGPEDALRVPLREQVVDAPNSPIVTAAIDQLSRYFDGTLTEFNLPLDPVGSLFQQRAWMLLRSIPYGETVSYGEQARRLGDPNMARAVGSANGQNPISIVVPCHRVIGSTGKLTGFGGGLEAKAWLLDHERHVANPHADLRLF
jgi:methylated-DNA-[protein]-cysteine S-methyltransferase